MRLVELLTATRDNQGWVARKPLPDAVTPEALQQVRDAAARGNKIEAIRLYRGLTRGARSGEAKPTEQSEGEGIGGAGTAGQDPLLPPLPPSPAWLEDVMDGAFSPVRPPWAPVDQQ